MSRPRIVLEITRWELARWFRIKSQVITLAIAVIAAVVFAGGRYLLERGNAVPVTVAVLNGHHLPHLSPAAARITLSPAGARSEPELRGAIGRRELDGLLVLHDADSADLVVAERPRWEAELRELLSAERRRVKLAELRLPAEQLVAAITPFRIGVVYHETARVGRSSADKIAAGLLVALMLIGIVNSLAYQMVTITGEKQLRVTEQVISAVTPQQWIDGKILGIAAFATITTCALVVSSLAFTLVMHLFGQPLPIPTELADPAIVLVLLAATVGGFFFWNVFLAAVAATIDDPNTSSRAGMLFLPLMPSVVAALLAMRFPDATWIKALTLLPITAPAVLPVRLVLSAVAPWEIAAALALLFASTWYLRVAAARIFHLGILMYGKEPSLKEMLHWIRHT